MSKCCETCRYLDRVSTPAYAGPKPAGKNLCTGPLPTWISTEFWDDSWVEDTDGTDCPVYSNQTE